MDVRRDGVFLTPQDFVVEVHMLINPKCDSLGVTFPDELQTCNATLNW